MSLIIPTDAEKAQIERTIHDVAQKGAVRYECHLLKSGAEVCEEVEVAGLDWVAPVVVVTGLLIVIFSPAVSAPRSGQPEEKRGAMMAFSDIILLLAGMVMTPVVKVWHALQQRAHVVAFLVMLSTPALLLWLGSLALK